MKTTLLTELEQYKAYCRELGLKPCDFTNLRNYICLLEEKKSLKKTRTVA